MTFVNVLLIVNIIFSAIKMSSGNEVGAGKRHQERNTDVCQVFARAPIFEIHMVVGKPWRVYYTWNMKIGPECVDISYQTATKEIIHRLWSDMNEYLEMQPNWEAAALLLTIGNSLHEVMLFNDQGPAGSFIGVANVMRDGNISPLRKSVSLIKFHMKLVGKGKYLVVMDCKGGIASLSVRSNSVAPTQSDINTVVKDLDLGEGHPACTVARNNEDTFLVNK